MNKSRKYLIEAYTIVTFLLIIVVFNLIGINLFPDGASLSIWIGATIGLVLGQLIRHGKLQNLGFLVISALMILNYILFRNNIYIPNYVVLYVSLTGLAIYYLYKSNFQYKIYIVIGLVLLIAGALALEYNMYENRVIKDKNLYEYIRKDLNIDGRISENDLKEVEKLFLAGQRRYVVSNLEGIQYFKNLKELYISDGKIIRDFSPIEELDNLRNLTLWYINLDKLEDIGQMPFIENLGIIYPKKGNINNLENFPNLKELHIQGKSFKDINVLKGSKELEILNIADGRVEKFEGVTEFSKLKELHLFRAYIVDFTEIFDLAELEKIQLQGCQINNQDKFEEIAREKGIELIKLKTLEERVKEEIHN